jgi:hypothetical protein
MPRAAIVMVPGARVVPLGSIASSLLELCGLAKVTVS